MNYTSVNGWILYRKLFCLHSISVSDYTYIFNLNRKYSIPCGKDTFIFSVKNKI